MKQKDKHDVDRLGQLYAAYGADPGRWPEHERWRHRDPLPPELVEGEGDARMVDRLLAMVPSPVVPAQNLRQLVARAAMAPARREATVLAHPRAMSKLAREWPAALALAASLAVGVWLGAAGIADDLLPSLLAGPVDVDTVALDPPDDLDFDSGGEM
jgi:hypothetical protein